MKKILFTIFIMFLFSRVNAIEKITINNDNLVPLFDKNLKQYNYYTNSDKIFINVKNSKDEIVTGDGVFELNKEINKYIINSNIYGDYYINIYKNYQKKEYDYGKLVDLKIEGYDINFNSDIYEYDIVINNEDMLNINYELLNDSSYVDVTGNGNFNNELNVIKINVDNINTYKINVHKTINVSKGYEEKQEINEMNYIEKEIVKIIIITISCLIVFLMFYILFLRKTNLHVLPNILHKLHFQDKH